MMSADDNVMLVQALYSFKGKNNDELCFSKGDIITITQKVDGGWWEGTTNDNTGWFPSNYVKEYKGTDGCGKPVSLKEKELLSPQHTQQQKVYRSIILKDLIESEEQHLEELEILKKTYLSPLSQAEMLSEQEFRQLVGNLDDVISVQQRLLSSIQEQVGRPLQDQRIGGAFLNMAPFLQAAHKLYCSNHPLAVCILEKYRDELSALMESLGAPVPGILFLTTGISQPFRRLDKYSGMLQEYQRHLEEAHADRGDTQRSTHLYRELSSACATIRRQKELELEVVTSPVHGWERGDSLAVLGDVLYMGSVALLPDHRDRYFVLFQSVLVVLAVSPRMSTFIFESQVQLHGVYVCKLDDCDKFKNAFEISGSHIESMVAICQTKEEQQIWVEKLAQQIRLCHSSLFKNPVKLPSPPSHTGSELLRQNSLSSSWDGRLPSKTVNKIWSLSCLRPSPPLRPGFSTRDDKRSNKYGRRKDDKWYEEDTLILRVIEAYCTSAKTRYTVNSALLDNPQVIIAEEEKIIVEEDKGGQTVIGEKSLVDTVYALKEQLNKLWQDHHSLKSEFEKEKISSAQLRSALRQNLVFGSDDLKLQLEPPNPDV